MPGRLIAIVGPSGVGKDTVIEAMCAARPGLHRVRRVITRPGDAGGEDFDGTTPQDFARRAAAGEFALAWSAHGLDYGIPRDVEDVLAGGRDAVVNLSRSVLAQAAAQFPGLIVLSLTAPRAVLAARLAGRGRVEDGDLGQRLDRTGAAMPPGLTVIPIANDGALDDTLARIARACWPRDAAE